MRTTRNEGAGGWNTARAAVLAILAVTAAGCGTREGPARVAVSGQVTLEGQPLQSGAIVFIPMGRTRGPKAGAAIEQGRYKLPRERGPMVGQLRVEISAPPQLGYDITEPVESVQHIGDPFPRDLIPPRYNEQSELMVETKEDGKNDFDFDLSASP